MIVRGLLCFAIILRCRTYIKKQKDVKDEITKTSSQEINMLREEMASLSQVSI